MKIAVRQPQVRALLARLFEAGLGAVDPGAAVRRAVRRAGATLRVGDRRYVLRPDACMTAIGAGKASARMAAALEEIIGPQLDRGLVVVKYDHAVPTRRIDVCEAGHPVPDQAGQRAAARIVDFIGSLAPEDLLFVLLSGGASSLLAAPASGLTLRDKRRTTDLLLRSGATIHDINCVRKHLSSIKGGRLAAATKARIVSLILSDVQGDDLGTIGSGPTAPDPSSFADARAVLQRYGIWDAAPARVRAHLLAGSRKVHEETPKPGSPLFRLVDNHIIGNNRLAVEAVAAEARRAGFTPLVLTTSLTGEAKDAARVFGAIGRELVAFNRPANRPACVIAGGELTVTVRGAGKGGRAQEFALAAALEITGLPGICIAALGTDGTDGPTDAAGAVVDGDTVSRAARQGIDPRDALRRSDSYAFFKKAGGHIVTGPTGTNVNDLHLLLAWPR
jgi:glycerate-2-kinase